MARNPREELSSPDWTLKKSVTSLAIAPQTESLTRTARMAYNLMIFKAQRATPDEEGGYCAPLSEIIKGFGATTRDSSRIKGYIEQMCTTAVRWFPLSRTDDPQATLAGMEPSQASTDTAEDGRIFTLLSEARFHRRSGEMWMTWFFPPTIKDMVIQPSRWAQLDIKEMATLSHYASVALYEI
ncbi:RepB family plasmid replication initiator protein, partial [Pseudomonas aeruginosa]|uniref:RepB family plasmid replication initiator protein n=1 Tax=Pseudomonas aeruginosa TaxID=287 RepID=UPI001C4A3AB5